MTTLRKLRQIAGVGMVSALPFIVLGEPVSAQWLAMATGAFLTAIFTFSESPQ